MHIQPHRQLRLFGALTVNVFPAEPLGRELARAVTRQGRSTWPAVERTLGLAGEPSEAVRLHDRELLNGAFDSGEQAHGGHDRMSGTRRAGSGTS
jgi:hypothetical protein